MNAIKQFHSYMDTISVQKVDNWNPYTWDVQTIYGPLEVSIHSSDFTKTGKPRKKYNNLSSIYCRFSDKKCEPFLQKEYNEKFVFNYKWNFHMSGGENELETWMANFENFKRKIEKILLTSTN